MAHPFNNKQKTSYSYLNDPHLFYHLQSPIKIAELLESGLYELQGDTLIQLETEESLKISSYTLNSLPMEIKQKYTRTNKIDFKVKQYVVDGDLLNSVEQNQKQMLRVPNKIIQHQKIILNRNTRKNQKDGKQNIDIKIKGWNEFKKKILS